MEKKYIQVYYKSILDDLIGDIDDAIQNLIDIKNNLPKDYKDIKINEGGYDDLGIHITYSRLETDAEYKRRLDYSKNREHQIEEQERSTLERLKAKYEV